MYVQHEKGEGTVAYHVMNLTPGEMRTIVDMDKKIAEILISHHPEFKGKAIYLSDNDLFKLRGILYAFARYSNAHDSNEFDAVESALREEFENAHCLNATEEDE